MHYTILKRIFDLIFAFSLLLVFSPIMLLIAIAIKLDSKGSVIYWSDRVGQSGVIFKMAKFRSMRVDAPFIGKRDIKNPQQYITKVGRLLRKTSLDELPQLFNVIEGKMSIIGPRPPTPDESKLIKMREDCGVNMIPPGITGLAQVYGRDDITLREKVKKDLLYLKKRSFFLDLKIIVWTVLKVIRLSNVSH